MVDLFSVSGPDLDGGYRNIRAGAHAVERELRETLEKFWTVYQPFADPNFVAEFAREPDSRFWEMYVAYQLLDAGKTLLPTAERSRRGGQPDVCVLDGDRRIWIEAIAPDIGDDGPDQVRGPVPLNEEGGLAPAPTRQVQLRTTSALWTKAQKITQYIQDGVIGEDEVALVAIGAGRFGLTRTTIRCRRTSPLCFRSGRKSSLSISRRTRSSISASSHPSTSSEQGVKFRAPRFSTNGSGRFQGSSGRGYLSAT